MQIPQATRVGGRLARTEYQYTLTDTNLDELNHWAPIMEAAMKKLPELRDVASDQQVAAPHIDVGVDRQQAERLGLSAARLHAPPTLNGAFEGTAQAFQTSLSTMPLLLAAAILVVYIVLGILYESYIHPVTILSALPAAGVGALILLWVCHYDLSVVAIIGIVLLIGIVKKNAIMMIDFALSAQRNEGKSPREAIREACLLRFRPIMMTTFAALFGSLPIALGQGAGSELRQPMGIAFIGGLLISQWLTLYATPVIYLYRDRLAAWLGSSYRPPRLAEALGQASQPAMPKEEGAE
jgi:multidrug efflux pump subunit AcrB